MDLIVALANKDMKEMELIALVIIKALINIFHYIGIFFQKIEFHFYSPKNIS